MKNYHKSPLRYPGGKSRAIKFLQDFFPKDFKEFREPFFGGGSVGLYLAQTHTNAIFFANDLNYDLYCFWQVLKVDSMRLIEKIEAIKEAYKDGRELHAEILSRRKQDLSPLQRAVDFFILNRISFSGLLDCGGYSQKAYESRFTQSSIERLRAMPKILQNFHFSSDDYEVLLQKEGQGVFIFLDPPYFSAIKSKLYGKKGDLHTSFDHKRLCENLKNTTHKFLLTYDDSKFIRELYRDFYVKEFSVQYGMNNFKQDKAQKGRELLISNFALSSLSLFSA